MIICFSTFPFKHLKEFSMICSSSYSTSPYTIKYLVPIQWKVEKETPIFPWKKRESANPTTFYFPYQWLKTEIPWPRMTEFHFTESCKLEVTVMKHCPWLPPFKDYRSPVPLSMGHSRSHELLRACDLWCMTWNCLNTPYLAINWANFPRSNLFFQWQ